MSAGTIIPGETRDFSGPKLDKAGKKKPAAQNGKVNQQAPTPKTSSAALPKAASAPAGQKAIPAALFFKQSAAALKLPVDTLSVTLLAMARFFSLPPSQALMGALRKEILASNPSSPKNAAEKAALEVKVLATMAALDKGVALSPEALERYARFMYLPARENGEPDSPTDKDSFSGGGGGRGNSGDKQKNRDSPPEADELKAIAEEQAKEDRLLDFLNTIPGKNGQYWVVFPLKITVRGTELKVFIRRLKGEPFLSGENEHSIVDIAGPKRQYRCFLKKNNGKLRADIQVYPELSSGALKLLSKKAGQLLLGFEEILVRNGGELASWAEDWCAERLPSIDKEV